MWGQGGTPAGQTESIHHFPLHLVDNSDDPGFLLGGRNGAVNRTNGCPCLRGHHQLRESESDSFGRCAGRVNVRALAFSLGKPGVLQPTGLLRVGYD